MNAHVASMYVPDNLPTVKTLDVTENHSHVEDSLDTDSE